MMKLLLKPVAKVCKVINRTEQDIIKNWKGNVNIPLVSVCTITYNHERFIAEALDSFLMQETDFPYELVVDDDCSTDGTADVINRYMEKFPNIIKGNLREKNIGMMSNFVNNFKRAKGKYIALCEGDDYWTDTLKLQNQVDFLEKNEEYVITYTSVEAFDEKGVIKNYRSGAIRDLESIELQKSFSINTLTSCFRNVLKEFPPEFKCVSFGDLFLWSLLGAHGKGKFLQAIKPARYRIHDAGVFSKKSKEHRLMMGYLTTVAQYAYYRRINNIPLSEYFHKKSVNYSLQLNGRIYYVKVILKSIIKQIILFIPTGKYVIDKIRLSKQKRKEI